MLKVEALRAGAPRVGERAFAVAADQLDGVGRMTLGDVTRQMQAGSEELLGAMGLGDRLRDEGLLWVLLRTDIRVARLPRAGERVTQFTWLGGREYWDVPVRYAFFSEEEGPLVQACSAFALMDGRARAMVPLADRTRDLRPVAVPGEPEAPELFAPLPGRLPHRASRVVRPGEIDRNGHMNNTCYVDWVCDLAAPAGLDGREPRHLWLEYVRELLCGHEVTLAWEREGGTLFVTGEEAAEESFSALLEF